MKKLLLTVILAGLMFPTWLSAQTLVSTMAENKNAILEEFTGVSCPNCPAAHQIVQNFNATYAGDFFVVAYHPTNSSFTNPRNSTDPDLRRGFADAFYNSTFTLGGRFMPSAYVNRRVWNGERISGRSGWMSQVNTILTEASPVNVGTLATYDTASKQLSVAVEVYYTAATTSANHLYVYLLEDSLFTAQSGSSNPNYLHKHIFRETLTTDQWGDLIPVSPAAGQLYSDTLTFDNSAGLYNMENCTVIAFVRNPNDEEILSGTGSDVVDPMTNVSVDGQLNEVTDWTVFPNPTLDVAYVSYNLSTVTEVHLSVFDVHGRMLTERNLGQQSAGTHKTQINMSEFASGTYFVQLRSGNQQDMRRIFVK